MKLVVGLGNPGPQYVGTRHNVGFEVIDAVARRLGWISQRGGFELLARNKFDGLAMDGLVPLAGGEEKVILLKPMTFMNLSGRSAGAASSFFQLAPQDVLIVLDDLALPCGKIRLRKGGSSGGHNGLRDIEQALGTSEYPRLRLGIDPAPPPMAGKDYVLGRFTEDQRRAIEPAILRAAEAAGVWMEKGIEAAMNQFNAAAEEPGT